MHRGLALLLLLLGLLPGMALAGSRFLTLNGLFTAALPPGIVPGPATPPDEEPPRAVFLRHGLAAGLAAEGVPGTDLVLRANLPPADFGPDIRGSFFLLRIVPSIREAGSAPAQRFEADCALMFPGPATLRHFDPGRLIGHCATLGAVPRDVICLYRFPATVCAGGLDAIAVARLAQEPGFEPLVAAWTAAPGEQAAATAAALLDLIRPAALAEEIETLLLSLTPTGG